MRLINCKTLTLEDFFDEPPPYAILSHRWLETGAEPTYQTLKDGTAHERKGYEKIKLASDQALRDGLPYLWVDTVCIDKTNHVELSTSINSMYRYYQRAKICYAYLNDVRTLSELAKSVWFTRGWTLQELLAPTKVDFYSKNWNFIGAKSDPRLFPYLEEGSGISNESVFKSFYPPSYTIAERMSWASKRTTARVEDLAYCLLGIFEVSMPLLYGEGMKAFTRLQEQIMQTSTDHSIFAWTDSTVTHGTCCSLLAWTPLLFAHFTSPGRNSADYGEYKVKMDKMRRFPWKASNLDWTEEEPVPWFLTNLGIQITLPLIPYEALPNTFYALLGYGSVNKRPAILVVRLSSNRFARIYGHTQMSAEAYQSALKRHGYRLERVFFPEMVPLLRAFFVQFGLSLDHLQMINAGFNARVSSQSTKVQQEILLIRSTGSLNVVYTHAKFPKGVLLDLDLRREEKKIILKSIYSIYPPPGQSRGLIGDAASILAIRSNEMNIGEMLIITACIIDEPPWKNESQYSVMVQLAYSNSTGRYPHRVAMKLANQLLYCLGLVVALMHFREVVWRPLLREHPNFEKSTFMVIILLPWIKPIKEIGMLGFEETWYQIRSWITYPFAFLFLERFQKQSDVPREVDDVDDMLDLQEDVD